MANKYCSGDPGGDLFTSPGDPAFWVHHGQMDRMWTYWWVLLLLLLETCSAACLTNTSYRQALSPSKRKCDLNAGDYAHITWANQPESRLTKLSDVIDMGYAAPSITIGEVMDTTSGPFCYFYL